MNRHTFPLKPPMIEGSFRVRVGLQTTATYNSFEARHQIFHLPVLPIIRPGTLSTCKSPPKHATPDFKLTHIFREVLLGLTGRDFTIIAASKAAMRGATILKTSDDKTRQLNKHTLLAFSGEAGDTIQFAEYIQANIALYTMRNETDLGPSAVASFVRSELARSLRSRKPYNVNLLLGGMDPITKQPSLYWLDYLASSAKVPYAAHGYAQ